jgi:hypothetical protein
MDASLITQLVLHTLSHNNMHIKQLHNMHIKLLTDVLPLMRRCSAIACLVPLFLWLTGVCWWDVPGATCADGADNVFDEDTCLVLPEWSIRSGPRKTIYFDPEKVCTGWGSL